MRSERERVDRTLRLPVRSAALEIGEVGEQALETVHQRAMVGIYLGHTEVQYGDNSYPNRS